MNLQNKLGSSLLVFSLVLTTNVFAMDDDFSTYDRSSKAQVSSESRNVAPLEDQLAAELGKVFEKFKLEKNLGKVIYSPRPEADFMCTGIVKIAKTDSFKELVTSLIESISKINMVASTTLSSQGHINIVIKDEELASYATYMLNDEKLGVRHQQAPKKVILDFGGPNIAKPMHVGHLRSSLVGDSLQRIFRFMGDQVISDIHLGDWGLHIGMVINGLKKKNPEIPYFKDDFDPAVQYPPVVTSKDLEEIYPAEASICKDNKEERAKARDITTKLQEGHVGYKALWKHLVDVSVADLKKNFSNLGINFDLWLGESSVNDRISDVVKRAEKDGVTITTDGAVVIPVEESTDKEKVPPLMLVKSGGGFTYQTTDIATIEERVEKFHPNAIIYVVDQRQSLHFKQVFRATQKLKMAEGVLLEHDGFGTINGKDGKPFKTRAGGVMKLEDLISMSKEKALKIITERRSAKTTSEKKPKRDFSEQESIEIAELVGISALKYSDLSHNRLKDYVFDLDKVISFQGETGPFLLYSAVRIKTILEKVAPYRLTSDGIKITAPFNSEERGLILTLSHLPRVLDLAYTERAPSRIAVHSMDIAKSFSVFYKTSPVLNKEQQKISSSRLALAILTLRNLELTLGLLGIKTPQHM